MAILQDKARKGLDIAELAIIGYGGYEILKFLGAFKPDPTEALARYDKYELLASKAGFLQIAMKWQKDKGKKLPKSGSTPDSTTILVGANGVVNANKSAIAIYNSKGIFNDDEDALYAAFNQLDCLAQLYFMNDFFQKQVSKDVVNIFTYVRGFLNDDERVKVVNILDKLPYYYGGKKRKKEEQ